jgi:hypothetical protein
MTKNGYVNSSRRIRSLHRQQDDRFITQQGTKLTKSSLSSSLPMIDKKSKSYDEHGLPSVITISTNLDVKQQEYDKHMRLVEVTH